MAVFEELAFLGSVFICVAIWWTIQASKQYYQSSLKQQEFQSSVTHPCCCSWHKFTIEGLLKVGVGAIGLSLQAYLSSESKHGNNGHSVDSVRLVLLYIIIMLSGVTDILSKANLYKQMDKLSWIMLALIYLLMAVLFWNPAYSGTDPFSELGRLESMLAALCGILVLLEAKWSHFVLLCLARNYITLVLGSWVWHMGLLVSWQQGNLVPSVPYISLLAPQSVIENNIKLELASLFFAWHCGVGLMVLLSVWMVTIRLSQRNQCLCHLNQADDSSVYLENRVYFEQIDILGD